jgi:hypothetical protein
MATDHVPAFGWMLPFVLLLLAMAVLPLATPHFWESNLRKLAVAALLALPVAALYLRHHPPALLHAASDYVSFIVLLGSLFVVSGGILVTGDIPARPARAPWRELVMDGLAAFSWAVTPGDVRKRNVFTFAPIAEVAALFAGIFVTMLPAQSLGLPNEVVGVTHEVLAAISVGAVFMGADTYIGNGPNLMVRAIAESDGVPMPSFFGYMLYSLAVLIPCCVVTSIVFFR